MYSKGITSITCPVDSNTNPLEGDQVDEITIFAWESTVDNETKSVINYRSLRANGDLIWGDIHQISKNGVNLEEPQLGCLKSGFHGDDGLRH